MTDDLPAGGPPVASAGAPGETAEPGVGEALTKLATLAALSPAERVDQLEDVHRLLQGALATLDGV